MQKIEIDKIRSYQTLVKTCGRGSYRTTDYKILAIKIKNQLRNSKVPKFKPEDKIGLKLHLFSSKKDLPDFDNATKFIVDVLEDYYNFNDKQIAEAIITKHEQVRELKTDFFLVDLYQVNADELLKKVLDNSEI